jgi:histidine triad (HIT) family protein
MADNIFLDIIAGKIPCEKVYEDDEVFAFRDISPAAPTHILILPKKPIPTLNDLTEVDAALVGRLFLAAKKIASQEGLAERGYRTVFNCNAEAGQTVFQLHLHLLGGRPMAWPPG